MTVRTGIVGDYRDDFEPHSTTNDSSQSTFRAIFVIQTTAFVSYVLVNKINVSDHLNPYFLERSPDRVLCQ
jgi:hypothetical protein